MFRITLCMFTAARGATRGSMPRPSSPRSLMRTPALIVAPTSRQWGASSLGTKSSAKEYLLKFQKVATLILITKTHFRVFRLV